MATRSKRSPYGAVAAVRGNLGFVVIGNVIVVKVEAEASAVHMQWIMDGYTLEVGDVLIYEVSENPVSQVIPQFNR